MTAIDPATAVTWPVDIDSEHFPDDQFRAYASQYFDADKDGTLSESEADSVTKISITSKTISSLKGVEYFRNLTQLLAWNNQLSSLDVSHNTRLTTLYAADNMLSSLDVTHNLRLKELDVEGDELTSLDVSHNEQLKYLDVDRSSLPSLDVSHNVQLSTLYATDNQLSSLDVSVNRHLTSLCVDGNRLSSLDISKNMKLKVLRLWSNRLPALDLSANARLTECSSAMQRVTFAAMKSPDGTMTVSMKRAGIDPSRVSGVSAGMFDASTGVVTFSESETVQGFSYRYDTKTPEGVTWIAA